MTSTLTSTLPHDPALPAVVHLTGPAAEPVLAAAVEAAGGRLLHARANHVQYRPGDDAVVRFDASVSWSGAPAQRETLLAATTRNGALVGTVPVTATVDDHDLAIGVWRWPFDPLLPALTTMVTAQLAADALRDIVAGPVDLQVVAYRPTERAVVRVTDGAGCVHYVKVLPPGEVAPLVERHVRLAAAGLPVPEVVAVGEGWLAMTELRGTTLRDLVKGVPGSWPLPARFSGLLSTLRSVELPARRSNGRVADAFGHAAMLQAVAPSTRPALDRITAALEPARERAAVRLGTVHGDLHEAQVIVADGQLIGLLDIDDAGTGDHLDDMATLVAHTWFRAIVADDDAAATRLARYADALTDAFRTDVVALGDDPADLDHVIAAVLVGLATGPYRVQRPAWQREVASTIALADELARRPASRMREVSAPTHRAATAACEK